MSRRYSRGVSRLSAAVLPLIRTRADLHRWSVANAHGAQMHQAVAILEAAAETEDPTIVLAVTQQAIASALKVVMRADDSSGIIGGACRLLLALHPKVAARAHPPAGKLVDWMMRFQFDNECDFFHLDPVAYAPALGEVGMASYRKRLAEVEAHLGPRPRRSASGPRRTRATGSPWTGTPNAWPFSTRTSRRSSAPTRKTARSPRGCSRPLRRWRRSARSTWRLTGRSAPPTSTAGINRSGPRTTGARCSPSTDQASCSKPGTTVFRRWPSSSTAAHLYRDAHELGPPIATKSWKASPALPGTRWCSR